MLILSRRIGESLMIGDDIEVKVFDVSGNNVRLGIQAPDDVTVLRDELYRENEQQLEEAV
ncbi:MAG: carbon storage regulator CsrA [Gammaproteobacteria bacterium]|nr:carbon storage regulator CsrA [Gammaproteobacteria bacterium]